MNPRRIFAIVYRYGCVLKSSPDRILGLYIWMLIDMVLWGFISRYLDRIVPGGFNAITVFLGAVLLSNFFARVMLNINMTFFEDMWARNFLNIFASPLTIREYLAGLIACGLVTSSFGLLLAFGTAAALFGFSPLTYGPALLPFLLILYVFGIALGIFGCAVVLARGPSSEWFIWPIPALMTPFVGVYYPIATLPHWMQFVSHALPPAYVFEGLRAGVAGQPFDMGGFGIGIGLAVSYVLLAVLFFVRVYKRALRSGLIARYSAENAN
ncbi:MAG: ABC transporter permease [Rickettsiales bacterium]